MSKDKDKPTTASGSTDISSGTTDVSSGSQPLPPPTPAPKPPGHEVDDALDQVENATNTGGVWGRPRR